MFEILYNMIICPPWVDYVFEIDLVGDPSELSLDAICFSLALGRVYLILRLYEQYSRWTNEKANKTW